jgi:hypothetical protein
MAAGGPGDHPLTDIINFNLNVYNKECDELIRQISKYTSINQLYEMFNWFDNFYITELQLKEFETTLKLRLDELIKNAEDNGWENKNAL